VARNRKRAKDRRARRPQPVASRRAATRAGEPGPDAVERVEPVKPGDGVEAADGVAPAAPVAPGESGETEPIDLHDVVPGEVDEVDGAPNPLAHSAPDVELADAQVAGAGTPVEEDQEFAHEEELVEEELAEEAEERERLPVVPGKRPNLFPRLAGFLQGSWRELQRVQWPDRRQVAQATGVVIGFVIVAGAFLGLSDLVAQKLVNFILK
jgi:preprotein translocase SecE subunit